MRPAQVGDVAEATFARDALERGFFPCLPWGNQPHFDLILAVDDRNYRVQVKSITGKVYGSRRRYPVVNLQTSVRSKGKVFRVPNASGFDVCAVLVRNENRWVFYTYNQIRGRSCVSIHPDHSRDNWEIFDR